MKGSDPHLNRGCNHGKAEASNHATGADTRSITIDSLGPRKGPIPSHERLIHTPNKRCRKTKQQTEPAPKSTTITPALPEFQDLTTPPTITAPKTPSKHQGRFLKSDWSSSDSESDTEGNTNLMPTGITSILCKADDAAPRPHTNLRQPSRHGLGFRPEGEGRPGAATSSNTTPLGRRSNPAEKGKESKLSPFQMCLRGGGPRDTPKVFYFTERMKEVAREPQRDWAAHHKRTMEEAQERLEKHEREERSIAEQRKKRESEAQQQLREAFNMPQPKGTAPTACSNSNHRTSRSFKKAEILPHETATHYYIRGHPIPHSNSQWRKALMKAWNEGQQTFRLIGAFPQSKQHLDLLCLRISHPKDTNRSPSRVGHQPPDSLLQTGRTVPPGQRSGGTRSGRSHHNTSRKRPESSGGYHQQPTT